MKNIEELKAVMRKQELTDEDLAQISAGNEDEFAQMLADETIRVLEEYFYITTATRTAVINLCKSDGYNAYCFCSRITYHIVNCGEDPWAVLVEYGNMHGIPYEGCSVK